MLSMENDEVLRSDSIFVVGYKVLTGYRGPHKPSMITSESPPWFLVLLSAADSSMLVTYRLCKLAKR